MTQPSEIQIFLAYADKDESEVQKIYQRLKDVGYKPWWKKDDILPGEKIPDAISQAIKNSHLCIACLSSTSVKEPGYIQIQFRQAVGLMAEKLAGDIYLIPLKLERCEIPALQWDECGVKFQELQPVNYWEEGAWEKLLQAIEYQTGVPANSISLSNISDKENKSISDELFDKESAMSSKAIEVFFSYAHEDNELKERLVEHLKLLERNEVISCWSDKEIKAGDEWKKDIQEHLNSANVILLLVSSSFFSSDFCWDVELQQAINRQKEGEVQVIPIILRPIDDWKSVLGNFTALPQGGKPVTTWENQDQAFTNIVQGIREVVGRLRGTEKNLNIQDSGTSTLFKIPNQSIKKIINAFEHRLVVPIIGAGVNSEFYIELASYLTKEIGKDLGDYLLSEEEWNQLLSNEIEEGSKDLQSTPEKIEKKKEIVYKLIQDLIGLPCSTCHIFPQHRPKLCPVIEGVERRENCLSYTEEKLAIAKMNIRRFSEYFNPKVQGEIVYKKLYNFFRNSEDSNLNSEVYNFFAQLPQRGVKRGVNIPLIVTTNYDDRLERAFDKFKQNYDVVYYVPQGDKSYFKHIKYDNKRQAILIEEPEKWYNNELPQHPIILKLYGNWKNSNELGNKPRDEREIQQEPDKFGEQFAITEEQLSCLSNIKFEKIPQPLTMLLKGKCLLFLGYSTNDYDLNLLLDLFSQQQEPLPSKQSWIVHQLELGVLDENKWKGIPETTIQKIKIDDSPDSLENFIKDIDSGLVQRGVISKL